MVLVTRAPVRISFGGGGTDLPAYYEKYGGLVVSTAINYYFYTLISEGFPDRVQIISADYRSLAQRPIFEDLTWDGNLSLPKTITSYFNIKGGITVFLASQIPPGTGLGSSGSMAVCLVKALAFWCGLDLGAEEVAELACYIEIEKMGMPVGKQDQYAAAYGGLNFIRFSKSGIVVDPLHMPPGKQELLEKRLMLFFTGTSRQSSTILRRQKEASQKQNGNVIGRLDAIKALGLQIRDALEQGDLDHFGHLLHLSWLQKRKMTEGISTPFINTCYETALDNGAVGGKITGAGGGGFLLLYCPEEHQESVENALGEMGLQRRPFAFDYKGVEVMIATPWDWENPLQQANLMFRRSVASVMEVDSSSPNNLINYGLK